MRCVSNMWKNISWQMKLSLWLNRCKSCSLRFLLMDSIVVWMGVIEAIFITLLESSMCNTFPTANKLVEVDNTLCSNTVDINIILHHDPNLVLLCFIIQKTRCLSSHSVQNMILSIYIIFIVSKVKCSILFNKKILFSNSKTRGFSTWTGQGCISGWKGKRHAWVLPLQSFLWACVLN